MDKETTELLKLLAAIQEQLRVLQATVALR
jgi:hypothetical protein